LGYSINHIARIINAENPPPNNGVIEHLLFDSRKLFYPATTLFFALDGNRRNGHRYLPDLYRKGLRNFVISENVHQDDFPEANLLKVKDTLAALQNLAAWHRQQFSIPVIGITGSNGKTIVKEWLYQLLHDAYRIVRSPKSYNSQIGVPVSVWEMNKRHDLAIFEAGISQPGEMERLHRIIQPTIGILTNIGEAHSEGFETADLKAEEKIKLFQGAGLVIYNCDEWLADKEIILKHESGFQKTGRYPFKIMSWGRLQKSGLQVLNISSREDSTTITALYKSVERTIRIPFTDEASVHNAITCWCVMLYLGIPDREIARRMNLLHPVNMRLELKQGINQCTVINDSYSADLSSLHIALQFLTQRSGKKKKTVILSDFFQTGIGGHELYGQIASQLRHYQVNKVIGIGYNISRHLKLDQSGQDRDIITEYYHSTEEYLNHFRYADFRDEAILVKGARIFQFEQIVQLLEQKIHNTRLEINLNAIAHNLRQYQQLLSPDTKVMVMVKAFAYGSGGDEIAYTLQQQHVDCLGVAYPDEGTELRKAGISIPVMVMNVDESSFETIVNNQLEPVLFSPARFRKFEYFLKEQGLNQYPVHLEIETGMNRLGFLPVEIKDLASAIRQGPFRIQTIFSHLAASEDPGQDEFSRHQFEIFLTCCKELHDITGYPVVRHIANSAAIVRHPQMHLDMVRLGIGLYGEDNSGSGKVSLLPAATLRSSIAQLRTLKPGETVSYNRKGKIERESVIATVNIGYADGFDRRLGNGTGMMYVRNSPAPVIGSVCMDMTMIDVTGIPGVKLNDEVIIFGKDPTIQDLASRAGTIPYEIMTGISQRVKRVYYQE